MKVKEIKKIMFDGDEDFPAYKDEDDIVVKNVYVFRNGNVGVFDVKGKQIPFLQGLLAGAAFRVQ